AENDVSSNPSSNLKRTASQAASSEYNGDPEYARKVIVLEPEISGVQLNSDVEVAETIQTTISGPTISSTSSFLNVSSTINSSNNNNNLKSSVTNFQNNYGSSLNVTVRQHKQLQQQQQQQPPQQQQTSEKTLNNNTTPGISTRRLHVSNIPFRFREADLRSLLG
ncbi:unnamed protein product, partial [Schistosoma turkestanicum]